MRIPIQSDKVYPYSASVQRSGMVKGQTEPQARVLWVVLIIMESLSGVY